MLGLIGHSDGGLAEEHFLLLLREAVVGFFELLGDCREASEIALQFEVLFVKGSEVSLKRVDFFEVLLELVLVLGGVLLSALAFSFQAIEELLAFEVVEPERLEFSFELSE